MIIWLKLKPLFLWMRHVTSDRRDSTSPSSLLHLLFLLFSVLFFLLLFSPYPFVLLPVFLSSVTRAFHTSSIHTLRSTFTQKKNILHWWPFFHLYFFSPSFCAVWVCIIEPPCLPHTHPHTYSHYHRCFLLSCTLLFLYFTPSFFLCPFVPLASFLLPYPSSLSPPPPPHPLSAVPVGLWAGQVWATAAFSKASAAAPATDPSNTATLTSVHTHLHSGCIITLLSIPVKSGLHVEPH